MRFILALAALIAAPATAEVRMELEVEANYLKPHWLPLSDGSRFAVIPTPDLQGTLVIRCWEHEDGALCVRSSENWVTGYLHIAIGWEVAEQLPTIVLPSAGNTGCTKILDRLENDGSLANCARLIAEIESGGPLALARANIDQVAPEPENLPTSILRGTLNGSR